MSEKIRVGDLPSETVITMEDYPEKFFRVTDCEAGIGMVQLEVVIYSEDKWITDWRATARNTHPIVSRDTMVTVVEVQ